MITRVIAITVAIVVVACLFACGGSEEEDKQVESNPSQSPCYTNGHNNGTCSK